MPNDVSDNDWAFVAPHLTLMTEDAPTMSVRVARGTGAGDDGAKRRIRGAWYIRQWNLWDICRPCTSPLQVNEPKRIFNNWRRRCRKWIGEAIEVAFADQDYTDKDAAEGAGIRLEVVKLLDAKWGLVLFPRRWVIVNSFAWAVRFQRLARDYKRFPEKLAGVDFLAFDLLMADRFIL